MPTKSKNTKTKSNKTIGTIEPADVRISKAAVPFLAPLVKQPGLVGWYPLDFDPINSTTPFLVRDQSGLNHHLAGSGSTSPRVIADQINGKPAIKMQYGSYVTPLAYTGPTTFKDILVVCKIDYASGTFENDYPGLITGINTGAPILGGSVAGQTVFAKNLANVQYFKGYTEYPTTNQQAPFAAFELVRMSATDLSGTLALDGLQIGQDRNDASRIITARIADILLYDTVRTHQQFFQIVLYCKLKFGLFGGITDFPGPDITGILWEHFDELPIDYAATTISHTYEDEGKSFNETTDKPAKKWRVTFTGLSYAEAMIFQVFADAVRLTKPFNFLDKFGVRWFDVRVDSYSRSHSANKSWNNAVEFVLVKYP